VVKKLATTTLSKLMAHQPMVGKKHHTPTFSSLMLLHDTPRRDLRNSNLDLGRDLVNISATWFSVEQ